MSQATKTKTKMEIATTEESPSFKRKRMLEIRRIVAKAVKQNKRVDLMDFEGTDISRVIIALQDALTDTQTRHKRASNHIAEQKTVTMALAHMTKHISEHGLECLMRDSGRIADLSVELRQERESHMETAVMLNEAFHQNAELQNEIEGLKIALRSALA